MARSSMQSENLRGSDRANPEETLRQARRVLAEALGIDSHIDTIQRVLVMGEDLGERHDAGHVDFPRLREGGMHAPSSLFGFPFFSGARRQYAGRLISGMRCNPCWTHISTRLNWRRRQQISGGS